MIPVSPKPEPANFDKEVRRPGLKKLVTLKINMSAPLPPKTKIPPLWRKCINDLHASYDGICAYLGIYIERATGAASADHFVAKSSLPSLAYEWSNYRLACHAMNSRKNKFDDVLDPFLIPVDLFRIEFISGRIYCNSSQPNGIQTDAENTIGRLGLNNGINKQMRARIYSEYLNQSDPPNAALNAYYARYYPFIWTEISRQGLSRLP